MTLNNLIDLRSRMPNYEAYKNRQRPGSILGVALHHSATANRQTGEPTGDAFSFFNYHVNVRGWDHGGYNYVITGDGAIQYALDDQIPAYHAGFKDPDDAFNLESGQYWNNHYLAICLSGWFSSNRTYQDQNGVHAIPNNFTHPTQAQLDALLALLRHLTQKYNIAVENVCAHRELAGNLTQCPGLNLDPALIRQKLRESLPTVPVQPQPAPGEHALLIPDTGDYLSAALGYIWKFQPDVSFSAQSGVGRWLYITALGPISAALPAEYQQHGVKLFQHFDGPPDTVQRRLDDLVARNKRFADEPSSTPQTQTYTVQSGDTLSKIALRFYGQARLWTLIFAANRDVLVDPARLKVGQTLKIPPNTE